MRKHLCRICDVELVPCTCSNVDCWVEYERGAQDQGLPPHSEQGGSCTRALVRRRDALLELMKVAEWPHGFCLYCQAPSYFHGAPGKHRRDCKAAMECGWIREGTESVS
jgi:hypothetical protein